VTITGTRPTRVTAYETPNVNKRRFGCRSGDGAVILCQMSNGATMKVLPWCNFKRHPAAVWYCIYGTEGMIETDRWGETYNRINVYREGDSHVEGPANYCPQFAGQSELSQKIGGHGGSDFYTMDYFLAAIRGEESGKNIIDVYQALDMTLPGALGYRSIVEGNIPIDIPDFRTKPAREKYRNDNWCCDPKLAGPGQPAANCSSGAVKISDSVYKKQSEEWQRSLKK
jgi:hypothetical protein